MAKAGLSKQTAVILLIIANDETRQRLMDLLNSNNYFPRVISDPATCPQF